MIVLDASFLIAHLDADDPHHELAGRLLVDSASEPLGASPVTLAEVLVRPARAGSLDQATRLLEELTVAHIPLTPDAPRRLAELRAATNLKLPDCCVLLAMETSGATLATFDERLAVAARAGGLEVVRTDGQS